MKKLFFLSFILSLLISCSKEETDPYKEFWGYHVKDTTGLKLLQSKHLEEANYLIGLRDKKLWIGKFDNNTDEQLHEWNSPEIFNTKRTIDFGYGEVKEYDFDLHIASIQLESQNEENLAILAQIGSGKERLTDLYIADQHYIQIYSIEKLWIELNSDFNITKWNNGYAITFNAMDKDILYYFYSQQNKDFFKSSFYSFQGDLSSITPINQEEVISQPTKEQLSRINLKTGKTLWKTNISLDNIPNDAKLSYEITSKENNFWTYTVNITYYSGKKDTRQFKINIDNGEIIYL